MEGPRPVVLSGPSGAGKSTLMKMLLRDYEGVFGFSVSHTTRSPRPGEVDGKDYHFSNREAMQEDIDDGTYIENAEFSGNLYGTRMYSGVLGACFTHALELQNRHEELYRWLGKSSVDEVRGNGLICILDVDIQGVRNIKQTDLDPIYVSIQPPSIEILEKRLRDRNTETEESLQKRLEAARVDMELSNEPGVFDMLIVNDDLEEAYEKLQSVLIEEITKVQSTKKERCNSIMSGPRPVVISGPSGAGKSTLLKKLLKDYKGVFGFSVSHTTRDPRPGEVDGKDYHFTNREAMQEDIDKGEFIETDEFSGNLYGTSKSAVQDVRAKGLICILDVDIAGVRHIKETNLDPIYISIQPPSIEVLEERLRGRATETEEKIQSRLEEARTDMEECNEPGLFDIVIVNDDLDEAYEKLQSVLKEEMSDVILMKAFQGQTCYLISF